jgi:hypothetical protein
MPAKLPPKANTDHFDSRPPPRRDVSHSPAVDARATRQQRPRPRRDVDDSRAVDSEPKPKEQPRLRRRRPDVKDSRAVSQLVGGERSRPRLRRHDVKDSRTGVRSQAPAEPGDKNALGEPGQHSIKDLLKLVYAASLRDGDRVDGEQVLLAVAALTERPFIDSLEAMQRAQLVTELMRCLGQFACADNLMAKEFFGKMVPKLSGAFSGGLDALKRYRGGDPGVTVHTQTIVGVKQNPGDPTEGRSPAPATPPPPAEIIGEFTEVSPIAPGKRSRPAK